jgi:hypothetical protein
MRNKQHSSDSEEPALLLGSVPGPVDAGPCAVMVADVDHGRVRLSLVN